MSESGIRPLTGRVNYDAIAPSYDQRTEKGYLHGIIEALQNLVRQVQARRILDVGCGTGRSLFGLADSASHPVGDSLSPPPICYGLDFSAGMLAQAHRFDPTYRLVRASAPLPPFAPASFDLIFCVHAFHHFPDKNRVIQSAYTLLQPGGALAIINFDPHDNTSEWFVYDYFEGAFETDLARFPSRTEQETLLHQVGFRQVSSPVVQFIEGEYAGKSIFDYYFSRKESCSQLILLTDGAYQAGLARMQADVKQAEAEGKQIVFRTRLKDYMCYGFKPT